MPTREIIKRDGIMETLGSLPLPCKIELWIHSPRPRTPFTNLLTMKLPKIVQVKWVDKAGLFDQLYDLEIEPAEDKSFFAYTLRYKPVFNYALQNTIIFNLECQTSLNIIQDLQDNGLKSKSLHALLPTDFRRCEFYIDFMKKNALPNQDYTFYGEIKEPLLNIEIQLYDGNEL